MLSFTFGDKFSGDFDNQHFLRDNLDREFLPENPPFVANTGHRRQAAKLHVFKGNYLRRENNNKVKVTKSLKSYIILNI